MKEFKKILVATDLSPNSNPAIAKAVDLAQTSGAELMIASAYEPPNEAQAEAVAPGIYEEWDAKIRSRVESSLGKIVEDAKAKGVDAKPVVIPGEADEAIVRTAQKNGVDLIVMGTHGRKGPSRFFVGSVAARVMANATCPVMTVRSTI